MIALSLLLNLPWTILGLVLALISVPRKFYFSKVPKALIIKIRSWWWLKPLWWLKGARGMAWGNIVILGPNELSGDETHELVHVEQFNRVPLVHPLLNSIETLRHGYINNKYEKEAYHRGGNSYFPRK